MASCTTIIQIAQWNIGFPFIGQTLTDPNLESITLEQSLLLVTFFELVSSFFDSTKQS